MRGLPQLRPTTFFVVIMLTISGFKVYDQMYMITQGGPGTATMTLVYYMSCMFNSMSLEAE